MVQGVLIDEKDCLVNTNPATGQVISRVPCTPLDQLDRMVELAQQVQQSTWGPLPAAQRLEFLRQGLKVVEKERVALAECIVQEMGKTLAEAQGEVDAAYHKEEYFDILRQSLQPQRRGSCWVVRQPLGVVTVISPWNFPMGEIILLVLPALASGNTVIVKPSEVAPESGARIVQALQSVLPPGVLQLAQGDGRVGAHLVGHAGVAMVAMTGSSATGQAILKTAAPQLKRFCLELGGKDPMIVFKDAALEQAARDAVTNSVANAGQVCCSIERIHVEEALYPQFCDQVVQVASTFTVGNGMDPNVKVGPMVSSMQRDKVAEHVQDAVAKGARLLYQSPIPENSGGNYYPVTVLADITPEMKIYTEETFGPVVALAPFDGQEDTAVRLANDTEYGLAGCVYTTDLDKAARVAAGIDAGQIGVNCYVLEAMDVGCPWVGHKKSGFGYHSGPEGFAHFSIPKSVVYRPDQSPPTA